MIVGTAGHIDHGKTTLVRALTGVDTDRLPEEKKRGISIELGYAFMDSPDGSRIGFVDVPGHERLVHTMLAGATGIDFALLLVAADDGVMPQTREHLAVLSLLGLERGAVVITKADRADAAGIANVAAQAAELTSHTRLSGAPVLRVSAQTGDGLDALRALLFEAARETRRPAEAAAAFRLAVDRVLGLEGVGTVVTGTAHGGRVVPDDELRLVPGERTVRVRSVHAQNRAVGHAGAGERCALGLAGIAREDIERGQWLVSPAAALATDRLDARISVWHAEEKSLRSGTSVHVHVGAVSVAGTVAVLDGDSIAPGRSARVQLVLRSPIGAWHGDRVVLRDASASRTVAGGDVLDPHAPRRYRRTPQRLAELDALELPDPAARLAAWLSVAEHGADLTRYFAAQAWLAAGGAPSLVPDGVLRRKDARGGDWALASEPARAAAAKAVAALEDYHRTHPDEVGPDSARLRRLAMPRLPEPLWQALLQRLQEAGTIARRGAFVHLPAHAVQLSAGERRIAEKVAPRLAEAGFEGAWARDLARDCNESEPLMRTTLARLAQQGELHQIVKDLYYPSATVATLAGIARRVARESASPDGPGAADANAGNSPAAVQAAAGDAVSDRIGSGHVAPAVPMLTAARFRDATGLGRKRAIQILEYFDRIGILRRVGDTHRVRTDSTLFTSETS